MILIFSIQNDYSTLEVMEYLLQMSAKVVRINADDQQYRLTYIDQDHIIFTHKNGTEVNLLDARAYWYRKGGLGSDMINYKESEVLSYRYFSEQLGNTTIQHHFRNENSALINYIFRQVESQCPVKLGSYFTAGLNRLINLELAKKEGLKIPGYHIVTNTSQIASVNTKYNTGLVCKSMGDGIYAQTKKKKFYTYTERLAIDEYSGTEVPLFNSLVMEEIKKKYEIRAFYLNGQFYSMAIFSQNNTQTSVDFRKYSKQKPNRREPYKLPATIENKLKNIFDYYQLNTGSVDLIKDEEGSYVFLEINPVGQFGMVSLPCNYNLEERIANYLYYGRN